jgi:sulfatase modifying factor 1
MTRLSLKTLSLGLAAVACLPFGPVSNAGPIQWVTVGDPGNAADTSPAGYGTVADSFQMMKYEFTNQQYTDFLNSVDANGSNPYSVYNASMGSGRGGISFDSLAASGSKYAVMSNMGDKPVIFVSWFDAARVSNWYQNGATSSSSTETGAYTLGGAISGNALAVNNGATFYVPTQDQWYKAAYYKGGGTNAGYWDYATQSDTAPTAVTAGTTGIGSAGNTGNFANSNSAADWNSLDGNVTTVGTNGGPSAYGAFDMSGNVMEWNDLDGLASSGSYRGQRSGDYTSPSPFVLSSSYNGSRAPSYEDDIFGFRLASPIAVPEPSTYAMALAGLACGGWQMYRRRRLRHAGKG